MLAGEQHTTRGLARRRAGIVLGESHPLFGHRVEARRADELLPVTTKVAVAEVIGEDVNDVWLGRADDKTGRQDD